MKITDGKLLFDKNNITIEDTIRLQKWHFYLQWDLSISGKNKPFSFTLSNGYKAAITVGTDKNRAMFYFIGKDIITSIRYKTGQTANCKLEVDLISNAYNFYINNNADGFAKIRPVSSHNFRIHDFTSYRGLLVMTGIDPDAKANDHIILSDDGKAAVWVGVIDDLWEMGKITGHGGSWKNSQVEAGVHSDPYLIGYYDKRKLEILHQSEEFVSFKIEIEPIGHAPWMLYKEVTINSGENFSFVFTENFEARWIRFVSNKNCTATALLTYN